MEWGSFLEVGCHHHTPKTPLYLWLCAASWRWVATTTHLTHHCTSGFVRLLRGGLAATTTHLTTHFSRLLGGGVPPPHTPHHATHFSLCAASWRRVATTSHLTHHATHFSLCAASWRRVATTSHPTPLYSLLALCGFLEVGCQRISDTSLLREKMRWYCRLLDRTLISSLPVCMYARQSWAATATTQQDLLTNSLTNKLNMQHTY